MNSWNQKSLNFDQIKQQIEVSYQEFAEKSRFEIEVEIKTKLNLIYDSNVNLMLNDKILG